MITGTGAIIVFGNMTGRESGQRGMQGQEHEMGFLLFKDVA